MDEAAVRSVEPLKQLPIFDQDDPAAKTNLGNASATSVAEAKDMVRLHELLHRGEYRPLFGVRYPCEGAVCVCVYFAKLDET